MMTAKPDTTAPSTSALTAAHPDAQRPQGVRVSGPRLITHQLVNSPSTSAVLEPDAFTSYTINGDRIRELLERPEPPSLLPGVLDPMPVLHLLVGAPKSGKTTFCANLALAFAAGVSPWPGAPALPRGRVVFVSAEQSAERVARMLARVARTSASIPADLDAWTANLGIIARDPYLTTTGDSMLTLDPTGLDALHHMLAAANELGDPVRLVVLDSLSRLAPPGFDENDNSAVTSYARELASIADRYGVYVLAIHHRGHSRDSHRASPIAAARGASAYGAVAQVVMTLDVDGARPRRRVLRVAGNAVPEGVFHFTVASATSPESYVEHFRPVLALAQEIALVMPVGGRPMKSRSIATRIAAQRNDGRPTEPSGSLRDTIEAELHRLQLTNAVISEKRAAGVYWTRLAAILQPAGTGDSPDESAAEPF